MVNGRANCIAGDPSAPSQNGERELGPWSADLHVIINSSAFGRWSGALAMLHKIIKGLSEPSSCCKDFHLARGE